nr:MAG: hypothetical protein DIU57_13680 [Pseudomonadota bacterium]
MHVGLTPALREAILNSGGKIEDLRSKGGCLWVYPGKSTNDRVIQKLVDRGFKYKVGRGYYFER